MRAGPCAVICWPLLKTKYGRRRDANPDYDNWSFPEEVKPLKLQSEYFNSCQSAFLNCFGDPVYWTVLKSLLKYNPLHFMTVDPLVTVSSMWSERLVKPNHVFPQFSIINGRYQCTLKFFTKSFKIYEFFLPYNESKALRVALPCYVRSRYYYNPSSFLSFLHLLHVYVCLILLTVKVKSDST